MSSQPPVANKKGILLVRGYLVVSEAAIGAIIGSYLLNGNLGFFEHEGLVLGGLAGALLCLSDFFIEILLEILMGASFLIGSAIGAIALGREGQTVLGVLGYALFGTFAGGYFGFLLLSIPLRFIVYLNFVILLPLMVPLYLVDKIFKMEIPSPFFATPEKESSYTPKLTTPTKRSYQNRSNRDKSTRTIETQAKAQESVITQDEFDCIVNIAQLRSSIYLLPYPITREQELAAIIALEELAQAAKVKNKKQMDQARNKFDQSIKPLYQSPNLPQKPITSIAASQVKAVSAIKRIKNFFKERVGKLTRQISTEPHSLPDKLTCPHCRLISPPSALRCDCGYNFGNATAIKPNAPSTTEAGTTLPNATPARIEKNITVAVPSPPITETTKRAAVGPVEVRQLHKQMQHEIFYCLQCEGIYKRQVAIEVEGIDILVQDLETATIIEIKTGTDCVMVLREAIGQLLEYQYFAQGHFIGKSVRLIAVSPLPLDNRATYYLHHLKQSYRLEIEYRQYVPGSYVFAI